MKNFNGKVLFLDRSDINTDEIIPARYLTEISKQALGPHALEDLDVEGFEPAADVAGKAAIVTKANFGCGSSREHAPWALEANGINLVIAENFARIFRQNMYNCGMLAVKLPKDDIDTLFSEFEGLDCEIQCDVDRKKLTVTSGDKSMERNFELSKLDHDLVRAGGWLEYADSKY